MVEIADRAGRRRFSYDAAGRVVAATDALGHTTRYNYDERGHLTAITDPLGGRTERGYDELGRLVAETDPLGRTTRFALRRRRPARRAARPDRGPASAGPTTGPAGSPGIVRRAGGPTIRIERDPLGRPVRITETGAAPIELRWDPAGRLIERRTGDRAIGWSYDADGLRAGLDLPRRHPDRLPP